MTTFIALHVPHAVTTTYQQMRAARAEGAPWPMVRFYMRAELRHALHAHPGYAQDCAPCYIAISRKKLGG